MPLRLKDRMVHKPCILPPLREPTRVLPIQHRRDPPLPDQDVLPPQIAVAEMDLAVRWPSRAESLDVEMAGGIAGDIAGEPVMEHVLRSERPAAAAGTLMADVVHGTSIHAADAAALQSSQLGQEPPQILRDALFFPRREMRPGIPDGLAGHELHDDDVGSVRPCPRHRYAGVLPDELQGRELLALFGGGGGGGARGDGIDAVFDDEVLVPEDALGGVVAEDPVRVRRCRGLEPGVVEVEFFGPGERDALGEEVRFDVGTLEGIVVLAFTVGVSPHCLLLCTIPCFTHCKDAIHGCMDLLARDRHDRVHMGISFTLEWGADDCKFSQYEAMSIFMYHCNSRGKGSSQ